MDLPSVSLSVGLNDKVIWSDAIGYTDVDTEKPVTINTKYRIGSITKSVTSLAVGKLNESGLLDLDAPIQNYVPYFPHKKYPITTRQLAGHIAGIRHYEWSLSFFPPHETYSNDQYDSIEEAFIIFKDDPLEFKPGTEFEYSTYGYNLIGAVIEVAAQSDYLTYMQEHIFNPLEMYNTTFDCKDQTDENLTSFYVNFLGYMMDAPSINSSIKWAGGGMLSTPTDLVKMGNALLSNRFLESRTKEMMFTPQELSTGEVNKQNYGIGWRTHSITFLSDDGAEQNYRIVHHSGTIVGGSSILILFPNQKLVLAMTTNLTFSDKDTFRNKTYLIAKIFLDRLNR